MPCYHPMFGIRTGEKTPNGKDAIKIVGAVRPQGYPPWQVVQIPCGKCIGCRLAYSKEWANRCMLELQYHDSAFFVTFTYDDAHVPQTYSSDPETGEALLPLMTLSKRDCQLMMKRLRKRFSNDRIRFYLAGEYGSTSFRPHYHAILFGLHLNDLVPIGKNFRGDILYNSSSLSACWCDHFGESMGHVVVAEVTYESCAYVARYTAKKYGVNDGEAYDLLGLVRPFTLMSRKPGIGRQYFDDHPECMDYDFINVATGDGGKKFRPPRYYEKLYDDIDPQSAHERKVRARVSALASARIQERKTNLDEYDCRALAERIKAGQIKSLRRIL